MSKFNALSLFIAVVAWLTMFMCFSNYTQDVVQKVEEQHLAYAVNYAADFAVDTMVNGTPDLGLDYAYYEYIAVGPEVGLDAFSTVFCENFDMSASEENFALIQSEYLKAFVVATYDGYYIGRPTRISDDGAIDTIFSIKQPYLYKKDDKIYGLNLEYTAAKLFTNNTISNVSVDEVGGEHYIPELTQKECINTCVSDSLMQAVYEEMGGNVFSTIYVPTEMTDISSTNPIDRVTVMAYMNDVDLGYGGNLEVFGIGGARVIHAEFVACYYRDGLPYYTYVEDFPDNIDDTNGDGLRDHKDIIEMLESPELAAAKGYYFDLTTI